MKLASVPADRRPSVALVGGGVHAVVVADCIRAAGRACLIGYADHPSHDRTHMRRMAVPHIGADEELLARIEQGMIDATILGMAGYEHMAMRRKLAARFGERTHKWWTAVHPTAAVSPAAALAEGVVVFSGAAISPLARIGRHAVINTNAVVEHHAIVEDFAVISPNATLCGCTHVGESTFIGAGATILTGVSIGSNTIVGAGAVVLDDVPDNSVVVGNPARLLKHREPLVAHLAEAV
ncbi:MAG: acetyltransferase [Planctomycetes bacterium]|nr:acetyltransferase [Planctomycetota bacterium]